MKEEGRGYGEEWRGVRGGGGGGHEKEEGSKEKKKS